MTYTIYSVVDRGIHKLCTLLPPFQFSSKESPDGNADKLLLRINKESSVENGSPSQVSRKSRFWAHVRVLVDQSISINGLASILRFEDFGEQRLEGILLVGRHRRRRATGEVLDERSPFLAAVRMSFHQSPGFARRYDGQEHGFAVIHESRCLRLSGCR